MTAKKTIGQILTCVTLFLCGINASAQVNYSLIVDNMLEKYPQSTLQDIYKSFFQDCFGPGHLINDTTAARNYLHSELVEMDDTAIPYYELVGKAENYYRVSLAVIKDGIVTEDMFFKAFIESAGKVKLPEISDWKEEWKKILIVVPKEIENYSNDNAMIDSVLSAGKYAIHHSQRFNDAYHPHYRLIDKETFEREMLPAITSYISSNKKTVKDN